MRDGARIDGLQSAITACAGLCVALITCACSVTPPMQLVTAEPVGCAFLNSVSVFQSGTAPLGDISLAELMKKARSLGGNTLQCCQEGDEIAIFGIDPRTGKTISGISEYIGFAYNCPAEQSGLPPNTSLERTRDR